MRSQCALYVDAGYLLAASATRLTGTSLRRGIVVDYKRLIGSLAAHAAHASELPLLRVYWYDAARNGVPDQEHEEIGLLPRVKVRLGRIGFEGEQKGVDLRIGLDMVAHARNAAVDVIFLVSGDDDLTQAVEDAQAQGVQVTVIAVPTTEGTPHAVSRHLQRAADGLELLSVGALDSAIVARDGTRQDPPTPTRRPTPTLLVSKPPAVPRPVAAAPSSAAAPTTPAVAAPAESAPAAPAPEDQAAATALVYSTTTGGETAVSPDFDMEEALARAIDKVVDQVLLTWHRGATPEQRADLPRSRPSIPRDVDRALLRDLSDRLGMYDLTDALRHQLRNHFWDKAEENGLL